MAPKKLTKADFKQFEADFKKHMKALDKRRTEDDRTFQHRGNAGAYLTPDMLGDKKALTGRKKLVMAYGDQPYPLSLKELNNMAAAKDRAERNLNAREAGIPIHEALKVTKATENDVALAKRISNATLFKITGNILDFRVTASGDTPNAPSHYKVRVRLEDWKREASRTKNKDYKAAAQRVAMGYVSFDCNCGRYIYWYQYLATIGNFDIAPGETVFPKIRNPKLKGVCCKHILKALMTIQQPIVQGRIAAAMQATAVDKDFEKIDPTTLTAKELQEMEKAGDTSPTTKAAFKRMMQAAKAFQEKQKQPQVKAAKDKHLKENEAKMKKLQEENRVARAAAKQLLDEKKALENQAREHERGKLVNGLKFMQTMGGMTDDGFKKLSEINNVSVDVLRGIAKEEGLL